MRGAAFAFASAALALAAGCASFTTTQESMFMNEDGETLAVEYGRSDRARNMPFVSPVTGETMDFSSKLCVRVETPHDGGFTAWQCMNVLRTGTMYKSTNGKWMYHANGITCSVFRFVPEKDDYLLVFQGVIQQAPKRDGGKR